MWCTGLTSELDDSEYASLQQGWHASSQVAFNIGNPSESPLCIQNSDALSQLSMQTNALDGFQLCNLSELA